MAIVSAGQTLIVSSGQVDSGTIILDGGIEIVEAGGSSVGTIVSNGGMQVDSGGSIAGAKVQGRQEIYAGTVTSSRMSSGGEQYLYSAKASAVETIVGRLGYQVVYSGQAQGTVISAGGNIALVGGTVTA